jgi:hypothetical protein
MTYISQLYFGYHPAAQHEASCPRAASRSWDVSVHREERSAIDGPGELRELEMRLACPECGVVEFLNWTSDTGPEPSRRITSTSEIGWGSKAETVMGLYLWAGPPIWARDERGPLGFFVTTKPERPREPSDCVAIVGWGTGKRGGIFWKAGLHPTGYGTVATPAPQTWKSRRSAVAWIAEQIETGGTAS